MNHGGGKEIRTPDPKLAKLVLYQLSYTPVIHPADVDRLAAECGGPEWTRTTDLTLIRRVL